MSDSPEGPNWWRATDGLWYPPEQFTGPPELRPGGNGSPAPAAPATAPRPTATATPDPSATSERSTPRPSMPYRRRRALVAAGLLAVLVVAGGGIWWILGRGDGGQDQPATSAGSTSTGPVRIIGTVRVESSVPVSEIAPTNCDEWSQLLRIQVQDPTGTQLTTFPPVPTEESGSTESSRSDGTKSLSCDLDFAANVPAGPSYDVVLLNVRDGGRPALTEPVEGAEDGDVEVPALRLSYACDDVNGCVLRRSA